jgi:hypothetical protein
MGYEWPPEPSLGSRFSEKTLLGDADECWEWTAFRNPSGYGMIRNGRRGMALAHRVAWALAHGPVPEGRHVLHHCDNPGCVNPAHLYIGTNADNVRDKVARGRSSFPQLRKRGELHPLAKLTAEDVAEIRAAPRTRGTGLALSRRFGVSPPTISRIRNGGLWRHD